jgi:hypothetical protein
MRSLTGRIRQAVPAILLIWIGTVAALAIVLVLGSVAGITPEDLLGDAAAVMDAPFYVGAVSNVGILLMAMTGAVCFFGYLLLRAGGRPRDGRDFLLAVGVISMVFCIDDLFQIHETLPEVTGRWGAQRLLYGAYAVGLLAFLVRYRSAIGASNWPLMFMALGLWAGSGLIDQVGLPIDRSYQFVTNTLEDTMKVVGIVSWTVYGLTTAFRDVASGGPSPREGPATLDDPGGGGAVK